ncbi:DUF2589 domain-containing protein [Chitinophaga sp. SYP-B3965]|uniref:DUF2589 domain-containing protein n=1 Tax=Chitinophaga sp. SYP-B3965 TaxID=2663120 RepID=UPI0015671559|nr:DUF2589 domain-containing protein [Chitinophaga sp. SYP-B3965]
MPQKKEEASQPSLDQMDLQRMIAGPLQAAMDAQTASAIAAVELMKKISFTDDAQVAMVDFSHHREGQKIDLKVPLVSLVPINCLRIEHVSVTFNVKLNAIEKTTPNARSTGSSMKMSAGYQRQSGKEKTRASFHFTMQMKAVQDELPPELIQQLNIPIT